MANSRPNLTVYYDGACPLCRREIGFYRRRRDADRLSWVDVSRTPGTTIAPGLSRDAALARFHVRDANGNYHSGGAAFSKLWRALPGFGAAGRLFALWPFDRMLDRAYRIFLRIRPFLVARLASRKCRHA